MRPWGWHQREEAEKAKASWNGNGFPPPESWYVKMGSFEAVKLMDCWDDKAAGTLTDEQRTTLQIAAMLLDEALDRAEQGKPLVPHSIISCRDIVRDLKVIMGEDDEAKAKYEQDMKDNRAFIESLGKKT